MKRATKVFGTLGVVAVLMGFAAQTSGLRINTTASIPLGLYQLTDSPVRVGEYVLFCPPASSVFRLAQQRGYIGVGQCPGGLGQMMKKVLAAKGDRISVSDGGVTVNGHLLANSIPLTTDPSGQQLPSFRAQDMLVGPDDLLLMSDVSAISFDARYFGLIGAQQILGVVRPIITR